MTIKIPEVVPGLEERPRAFNEAVLLRNRSVFRSIRNREFERSAGLLVDILDKYASGGADRLDSFMEDMDVLVATLERARYCARMSVGGNNLNPPAEISFRERAFVDHIETMYSFARSIRRMLRHEVYVRDFRGRQKDLDDRTGEYVRAIQDSEAGLVISSLQTMLERIRLYEGFFGEGKPAGNTGNRGQ